jgi:hypothetical protein
MTLVEKPVQIVIRQAKRNYAPMVASIQCRPFVLALSLEKPVEIVNKRLDHLHAFHRLVRRAEAPSCIIGHGCRVQEPRLTPECQCMVKCGYRMQDGVVAQSSLCGSSKLSSLQQCRYAGSLHVDGSQGSFLISSCALSELAFLRIDLHQCCEVSSSAACDGPQSTNESGSHRPSPCRKIAPSFG